MGLIFFINSVNPICGVHQYGRCLHAMLSPSTEFEFRYCQFHTKEELFEAVRNSNPQCIIYNWQSGIGDWMSEAPFKSLGPKQILVFHDLKVNDGFDRIIFSDPTAQNNGIWRHIGRPIPIWTPTKKPNNPIPVIGLHGFMGAWAWGVLKVITKDFEEAIVRVHMPYAAYGDGDGAIANGMAGAIHNAIKGTGIKVQIQHEFMPSLNDLLGWLSQNDINCYVRDYGPWRGVSSALDAALAVNRPIAINKCEAFRHIYTRCPFICVEDHSLQEIYTMGLKPLKQFKEEWSPERVRASVENVIHEII